jgi:hypothetical protein
MCTRIFMCLPTKLTGLHHVDESRLKLESIVSNIDFWSSTDVGSGWSREFTESLISYDFKFWLSFALSGCLMTLKLKLS